MSIVRRAARGTWRTKPEGLTISPNVIHRFAWRVGVPPCRGQRDVARLDAASAALVDPIPAANPLLRVEGRCGGPESTRRRLDRALYMSSERPTLPLTNDRCLALRLATASETGDRTSQDRVAVRRSSPPPQLRRIVRILLRAARRPEGARPEGLLGPTDSQSERDGIGGLLMVLEARDSHRSLPLRARRDTSSGHSGLDPKHTPMEWTIRMAIVKTAKGESDWLARA